LMKSSGRYTSYICDFDGTLFDLPVDWKAVRKDLYTITGVEMEEVSIFKVIGELTASNAPLRSRLFATIEAHEAPADELAAPIEGALELVLTLEAKGRLALVTMQGRVACTRVLDRYGLTGRFRPVLSREDSLDRGEQLQAALQALGAYPKEALFVGDKKSDLEAGREVGVDVALVGKRARKEWKPDYLFPRLAELQAFLG